MPRHYPRRRIRETLVTCLAFITLVVSVAGLGTVQASPPTNLFSNMASPNGLVINEIYDSQAPANEYFELYNGGASSIDLSTYVIYNRDGSTPLSNLASPNIAPGQYKVIGPAQLGTPTIAGTGLARTDFLGLVNTSPSDAIIDVINFGASPNPNWPNYDRFSAAFFTSNIPQMPAEDGPRSLQRWPDGFDTDQGTDPASINSSPGAASCADPSEDDNTLATPKEQVVGTDVLHRLCPAGDQDFISINVSTGFTYTIQTTNPGSAVDTVLRLYDSSNALIATDDNPAVRTSTISFRPASNGIYKAQVTNKTNLGSNGPNYLYTVSISAVSATTTPTPTPTTAVTGCLDSYEPDDNQAQAKYIDLNTEQVHILCLPGAPVDQDWVVFSASSGKLYTMYTEDLAASVDTIITLFDGGGRRLAENDDGTPGQGLGSRIDYTFGSTGIYFLRVRDKRNVDGIGYQYTVGLSSTGSLPPTATASPSPTISPFSPTPTPAPCTDGFEPDGVPEAASLFLIGQTQRHSICPATDADWVRFYARAGKVYTIRTTGLGVGLDTYMFLFDSNASTILAENDDAGDGSVSSRIDFYPIRDDWYFAQVKNAGDIGGSDQTYELSLTVVSGVPQPPSTATVGGPVEPPPVTPTTGVPATTPPQPTKPPISTPTQGVVEPTPIVPGGPPPVQTSVAQPTRAVPTPTEVVQAEPTPIVPGPPRSGGQDDNGASSKPKKPSAPAKPDTQTQANKNVSQPPANPNPAPQLAPLLFRIFYDRNRNDAFEANEGIRGIDVYFITGDGSPVVSGQLITSERGTGSLKLPPTAHKVVVPYLGINMKLGRFPARDTAQIWLPPVALPDRVP